METIRGEYWIVDGSANYADGDVGDTNHEGYALDHLRRIVLEACDLEPSDCYDWDELLKDIPESLNALLDLGLDNFISDPLAGDVHSMVRQFARHLELDPEDLDQAFEVGGGDVRDYMCRKHGWIVCHNNRFAVWHLTRDAVKQIAEAVGDILDQEGSLYEEDSDADLEIFVASTNNTYEVLWSTLESEDYSSLPLKQIEPAIGPNAQVAAMDLELVPEFYKQYPSL